MESVTTLEGQIPTSVGLDDAASTLACVLVVCWTASEPDRIGQVLAPSKIAAIFGRGVARDDDGAPRLLLARHRPGSIVHAEPFENPFLSRRHLSLSREGDGLRVENLGKRTMTVNGREATSALVVDGDLVEIEDVVLFRASRRLTPMPPLKNAVPLHPFGKADAHGIVGESPAAWALRDELAFAAGRDVHVLLLGVSGSGKELAANAIHALSSRRSRRLVARNAATLPASLIDAELFGHAAGYPNAGMPERPGLIGEADGSTLFLDEIGELSSELQAHLLRVLDGHGEYQRLGEARRRMADFRLVGATNRDVSSLKHDFAARLTLRVRVPALMDRIDDVPLLVRHLLHATAAKDPSMGARFFSSWDGTTGEPRLSADLVAALLRHKYETDVRELSTLLWRSLATSPGGRLALTEPLHAELGVPDEKPEQDAREVSADDVRRALEKHKGIQAQAWRELGLKSRYALYRLMRKYGIASDEDR